MNRAAGSLYGYSKEEFLTLDLTAITAEPEASARSLREVLNSDQAFAPIRYHRKKGGAIFPVEIRAGTFLLGGRKVIFATNQDISERMQAEEALKESRATLDPALRSAQMGTWQWDIMSDRRRFDDQACKLLGLDPRTFSGDAAEFFAAVHPDDRENLHAWPLPGQWNGACRVDPRVSSDLAGWKHPLHLCPRWNIP